MPDARDKPMEIDAGGARGRTAPRVGFALVVAAVAGLVALVLAMRNILGRR